MMHFPQKDNDSRPASDALQRQLRRLAHDLRGGHDRDGWRVRAFYGAGSRAVSRRFRFPVGVRLRYAILAARSELGLLWVLI